jgi:hypothetical protein
MVRLEWQQPLGPRTTAELHLVGGYAFNSTGKPGKEPLDARVAVGTAVDHVDNSFAWEARLALWHDVSSRIGLMAGVRYLRTRPELALADGSQRTWKADRVTLQAGVAFTLLKAPWQRDPSGAVPRR